VTAVLVVFRGFDTFGEVAVVFAAGVAVLVVLREVS
jgi:multicomponent Na+:H+ antiporter subunit B